MVEEKRIDNLSRQFSYNRGGHLTRVDEIGYGDRGERPQRSTEFERDSIGRLLAKLNADARQDYTYDDGDRLLSIARLPTANGKKLGVNEEKLDFAYDLLGRLIKEITPQGALSYDYDPLSNLTTLTLPTGQHLNHLYYGSGHLHQLNLDGQLISDMERDDLHREVLRTQGKLTSCFGYDAMGRKAWQFASTLPAEKLSQVHNPGINTSLLVEHAYNPIHRRYQYDPAGELTRTLDKLRGEIKYEYEANGQLHSRDTGQLVDSEEFRYDAAANRLNFNTSQFDHVKDNRIKQWRDQEYAYDAWGNLVEKRSGMNRLHAFTYDCENRLVRAETLLGSKLESTGDYRYDSLGRRVAKVSQVNGVTEQKHFLWQGLRMLREETPGQSSLYVYEPGSYAPLARVSNLTTLTLPTGQHLNHLYYGSGHLHQLNLDGQLISDMERDDLHREVLRTQGTLTSCFGYDAMGRKAWQFASTLPAEKLSQILNPGIQPELLVEHAYNPIHRRHQYDPAGELTRTLDKLRGEIKYDYEANGQLHSRDTGKLVDSEEFRYDAAANRLNFNTSQFDHVKDNRIKQWRDQEYAYDAWGNLIEKRSGLSRLQTFSYDGENRLVKAETLVNGKLESSGAYRYDSLGRRVAKVSAVNGVPEQKHFLWQGLRMLREETPGQSRLYLYEPGSYAPLARVDQAEGGEQKLYYFHTDQIGTPLEMTDADGSIVWQATYKAWGALERLEVDDVEQNLRFQGQYFDDETGLHYNTFRYYDPQVGRFITQDPISILGGANLYQYAVNPLGWLDPLGWAGNPANATHITYEGIKNGKPYIGYASKPGLGHAAQDVLEYRYSSTAHFDIAPEPIFVGDGQAGKDTARGLEQRIFEERGGLDGTSNKQNPVGKNNPNRNRYLATADNHQAGGTKTSGAKGVAC